MLTASIAPDTVTFNAVRHAPVIARPAAAARGSLPPPRAAVPRVPLNRPRPAPLRFCTPPRAPPASSRAVGIHAPRRLSAPPTPMRLLECRLLVRSRLWQVLLAHANAADATGAQR
eukprot:2155811-Prymnesium_polylepis.1